MGKGEFVTFSISATPYDALKTQVIIAALNEEKGIGLTIDELNRYLYNPRIIVVDSQSIDRTIEVAKNLRTRYELF